LELLRSLKIALAWWSTISQDTQTAKGPEFTRRSTQQGNSISFLPMSVQRKFNKANGVDDLVLMDTITEAAIVVNLKKRFSKDLIYTYIGNVLLSVNPFRNINGMYGESIIQKYTGRKLYELAPHVYALAEDTYRAMMSTHDNQCVLISGESGAGKTEAAKKLLSFITAVSGSAEDGDHLKEQLLKSNPVLEAFGNAKTVRNDNSSRFGKYMKLSFDYNGIPVGGKNKPL
jgi:myosin-1